MPNIQSTHTYNTLVKQKSEKMQACVLCAQKFLYTHSPCQSLNLTPSLMERLRYTTQPVVVSTAHLCTFCDTSLKVEAHQVPDKLHNLRFLSWTQLSHNQGNKTKESCPVLMKNRRKVGRGVGTECGCGEGRRGNRGWIKNRYINNFN